MRIMALLVLGLLVAGCSTSTSTDRLAETYVDLLRYRDATAAMDTAAIRAGVDSVLTAHGYRPDTYRQEFGALAREPRHLASFFDRVERRIAETDPALQPAP